MSAKQHSRKVLIGGSTVAVLALLAWAFWPSAMPVDIDIVKRGSLTVTIDEVARTRVHDVYTVSAPFAGSVQRIDVDPGDEVVGGESVMVRLQPAPPASLNDRSRTQVESAISAARSNLQAARAQRTSAIAEQTRAATEYNRVRTLLAQDVVAPAALEMAEQQKRVADAAVDAATAAIAARTADLARVEAELINFDPAKSGTQERTVPLLAPITGQVLTVNQKSEAVIGAGQPLLQIGDISGDLEIVAELLSSDAVEARVGDRVLITNYGGSDTLSGVVKLIEPFGITKYSALGVEEQRVNAIISFDDPAAAKAAGLGHGYRVEVQIVTWENDDALIIPASALFRYEGDWATYKVEGGRTRLTPVEIEQNNGLLGSIVSGLVEGDRVVLYPGSEISDGIRVRQREISD